jgi:hypothetical protein
LTLANLDPNQPVKSAQRSRRKAIAQSTTEDKRETFVLITLVGRDRLTICLKLTLNMESRFPIPRALQDYNGIGEQDAAPAAIIAGPRRTRSGATLQAVPAPDEESVEHEKGQSSRRQTSRHACLGKAQE